MTIRLKMSVRLTFSRSGLDLKQRLVYLFGMFTHPAFNMFKGRYGLRGVPELDDRTSRVFRLKGHHTLSRV